MTSPGLPTAAERDASPADTLELVTTDPERLRDRLTVEHLLAFARSIDPDVAPISFQRDWWDGSATTGCLLVDIDRRRYRVVSTGSGTPVLLPARRVRARRALTASRRASSEPPPAGSAEQPEHVELTTRGAAPHLRQSAPPGNSPVPSTDHSAAPALPHQAERRTVIQSGDYLVCRYADCGGLLPVGEGIENEDAGCPSCGRR